MANNRGRLIAKIVVFIAAGMLLLSTVLTAVMYLSQDNTATETATTGTYLGDYTGTDTTGATTGKVASGIVAPAGVMTGY